MLMQKIGEQLRKHRERRGLTQADVAAALGTSPQSVSLIEKGRTATPLEKLSAQARIVGAELEVLILAPDDTDDLLIRRIRDLLPRLSTNTKLLISAVVNMVEAGTREKDTQA